MTRNLQPASPAGVWRSTSLSQMMSRLACVPLAYQPGERWLYNLSMDVQGAVIEALPGQSLPDFMQSRIFGPLGMTDTAVHTPPHQRGRRAVVYRLSKRRGLVPAEPPLLPDYGCPPGLASGGGGLISTAMDYARFAQILFNGGEFGGVRIVSADGLKQMMSSRLSEDFIARRWGVGHQQLRPGFSYGYNGVVFTDPALAGIPVGTGTCHWDGRGGGRLVLGRSGQRPSVRRHGPADGHGRPALAGDDADADGFSDHRRKTLIVARVTRSHSRRSRRSRR